MEHQAGQELTRPEAEADAVTGEAPHEVDVGPPGQGADEGHAVRREAHDARPPVRDAGAAEGLEVSSQERLERLLDGRVDDVRRADLALLLQLPKASDEDAPVGQLAEVVEDEVAVAGRTHEGSDGVGDEDLTAGRIDLVLEPAIELGRVAVGRQDHAGRVKGPALGAHDDRVAARRVDLVDLVVRVKRCARALGDGTHQLDRVDLAVVDVQRAAVETLGPKLPADQRLVVHLDPDAGLDHQPARARQLGQLMLAASQRPGPATPKIAGGALGDELLLDEPQVVLGVAPQIASLGLVVAGDLPRVVLDGATGDKTSVAPRSAGAQVATVDDGHPHARLAEPVGGRPSGDPGADDEDVDFERRVLGRRVLPVGDGHDASACRLRMTSTAVQRQGEPSSTQT